MLFNNKQLKDWKEYSIKTKIITLKTIEYNDWSLPPKEHEYNFNSEEELDKWLDEYNLGSYEVIQEIIEGTIYEFDTDKYNKQWN